MNRRTYLSVTAAAALASTAGCQGVLDGGDAEGDETGTPTDRESVPTWRTWIPSELVISTGADVLMLDTGRAKAELPEETYAQFQIGQIAEVFGVSESSIDRMTGVQRGEDNNDIVLTGSYNTSEILSNFGVSQSETENYGGYRVIQNQFAIGGSAIIVSRNYETLIDTNTGDQPYLGENDDDWDQLLTAVQGATLAAATPGTISDDSTIQADKSAVTVDAADDGGAKITIYVHFGSESAAEAAMNTAREEFVSGASGNSNVDIQRFDRQGSRIIVEGTTPNFSF